MYVDNMGRPREIIEKTDAKAGDDVYLTIDRDLQIAIYKLIEQQLAGIISYHLQYDDLDPNKTYDPSKIPIPVKDAYYQLMNNNVLSLMEMCIRDRSKAIEEAYKPYMMQHKYPFTMLHFHIEPDTLDVNVRCV